METIYNSNKLKGKKIAILVADGFEESEFVLPRRAVESAGAFVDVISLTGAPVKSWVEGNWSKSYDADKSIAQVTASEYDSLILPGGVLNPDHLRSNFHAVEFVRNFAAQNKPISAICHAPSILAEANILENRKVTSFPSIRTDIENAGATWIDKAVVVDGGLTTSRRPEDLPAFCNKLVEEIAEGKHQEMSETVASN